MSCTHSPFSLADLFNILQNTSQTEKLIVSRGYMEATKAMMTAMKASSVTRLVMCHSWYTEEASRGQAIFFIRWFLLPMIKSVLDNMREVEVMMETQVDDINWTVVRPAGLTDNPVTDKEFKVEEDFHVRRKHFNTLKIFSLDYCR